MTSKASRESYQGKVEATWKGTSTYDEVIAFVKSIIKKKLNKKKKSVEFAQLWWSNG